MAFSGNRTAQALMAFLRTTRNLPLHSFWPASLRLRAPRLGLTLWPGLAALAALLALVLLVSGAALAQPAAQWSVTLGGDGDEFAHAVALSGDGGFLIAGEKRSFGPASQDGWLVKLDANGKEVWDRRYGGPESDIIYSVQRTSDGGYILAGETHSFGGATASRSNFWLIKINSEGQEEWQRSYDSTDSEGQGESSTALAVRQTQDGGYILAGSATGPPALENGGTSIRLVRTDPNGELLWTSNAGFSSGALAYDIAEAPDGGFVIVGNSSAVNSGAGNSGEGRNGSDALLIKTDADGALEWSKTFGGSYNDEARSLALTSDGGYALGGFTWSRGAGLSDFWLVKANSQGEDEWQRTFGGVPRDAAHALIQTSDGGFALAGWSESFIGGDRSWVVKTDSLGSLEWSTAHPLITDATASATAQTGQRSAGARAIRQTPDGGFIVVGWTGAIHGARDVLVVKLKPAAADSPAPTGNVTVLENTGTASITTAAVGFDTVNSGQPLRFWHNGRLIDRDNPLPAGQLACTQPAPRLLSGARLTLDQFGSFDSVYVDVLTDGEDIAPVLSDRGAYNFAMEGGIAGNLRVVSQSPCEESARLLPEGPSAPSGLNANASASYPGSISLDWRDNTESDIFGYAVYVSRSIHGPFVRRAWLLSESKYADTGRTDGASYYFAVTAINSWGTESPKSTVIRVPSQDFTPPRPPTDLRVNSFDRDVGPGGTGSQGRGTAQLEWSANSEADLSGYRVYRQDGDGPRSPVSALLFTTKFEDRTLPPASGNAASGNEGEFSYSVTAIDLAGNESEGSNIAPPPMDFFGKVLEVRLDFAGGGSLSVNTARGRVDVEVVATGTWQTEVRVPNRASADLGDLTLGDQVAVSLIEDAAGPALGHPVARQVFLVPTKTRNRHLAGSISSLTENSIVIQPLGESSEPVTFQLSESVVINLHQGVSGMREGGFVIVSYIASNNQNAAALTEINAIPGREPGESPQPQDATENVAVVRGVFQSLNADNASIILSSTEVGLDVNTVMTTGVSVGDAVVVEALLRPDGSLLARRVEHDEGVGQVAERTVLRGVFQGIDAAGSSGDGGHWIVSGVRVLVDAGTYTDALPVSGQRVRVTAIVQEDGALYAREIENLAERENPQSQHTAGLEGILREITALGTWNVGGVPIRVDGNTALSGRPSVGRRVTVTAIAPGLDNGGAGLLATIVEGAPSEQSGPVRSVIVRGVVDQVEAGQWLVVEGVRVLLSDLTQSIGDVGIGSNVRVSAELQPNGDLLARQVAESTASDETGETRANPVNIEGRVERIDRDGSLVVNGIPVAVSALTAIDAALHVGASVQVRGLLQHDGSVLAREILGYGPSITGGTQASVAGVVERVSFADDGRVTGFVIDEIFIVVDQLTRIEVELTSGVAVVVQGIVIDGEILAVAVEPRPTGSIGSLPLAQMEGTVERGFRRQSSQTVDITVNGITVRMTDDTTITGAVVVGAVVRISGSISGSVFFAREVERLEVYPTQAEESSVRFNLSGIVEEITLDSEGEPETLLLSGNLITIVPLTVFQDEVSVGDSATALGIIRDGALLAALVSLDN